MKIVLPVHHFPPRYSAGAELYTLRLARQLQARGHDAEVVCVEAIDAGRPGELQAEHDNYQGIPVWRLTFNLVDAPERQLWNFDNPLLGAWFAEHVRQARPDLIHFQAGYLLGVAPLRAAHAAGIPSVLTLHDYWFLCPRITLQRGDGALCASVPADPSGCVWCRRLEQRRYRVPDQVSGGMVGLAARAIGLQAEAGVIAERRRQLHQALGLPDAVIAPSRFLAQRFAAHAAPERMYILRYGIDLTPFQHAVSSQHTALRIGFLGQVAPHKGVHLLIEAFRMLHGRGRPIELHIHGGLDAQPDYVAALRQRSAGDTRIVLHGRFEHSAAPAILAGLDVVVVPSTWYENSPLAIMEAHAAGVPVVTAALGGMAELVQDGVDGLHVRAGDAADLARALQRFVDEPRLLATLRAGIRMPTSVEQEVDELGEIYTHVMHQPCSVAAELL
jgi:glycosyltransferase involved in cell wall biosynthesis